MCRGMGIGTVAAKPAGWTTISHDLGMQFRSKCGQAQHNDNEEHTVLSHLQIMAKLMLLEWFAKVKAEIVMI